MSVTCMEHISDIKTGLRTDTFLLIVGLSILPNLLLHINCLSQVLKIFCPDLYIQTCEIFQQLATLLL